MYKSKKIKAVVIHSLNLEFESRSHFTTSDILKKQDRAAKILEAYACFREVMLAPLSSHFSYCKDS